MTRPYRPRTTSQAEWFWSKVDKNGPLHPLLGTRCWFWIGRTLPFGYGCIDWRREGEPRNNPRLAHRVAWLLGHGEWPTPYALHHCDNPPCVNYEDHLFEGTSLDNARDCARKGRFATPAHTESARLNIKRAHVVMAALRLERLLTGAAS